MSFEDPSKFNTSASEEEAPKGIENDPSWLQRLKTEVVQELNNRKDQPFFPVSKLSEEEINQTAFSLIEQRREGIERAIARHEDPEAAEKQIAESIVRTVIRDLEDYREAA